jgi:hypothetical protein
MPPYRLNITLWDGPVNSTSLPPHIYTPLNFIFHLLI